MVTSMVLGSCPAHGKNCLECRGVNHYKFGYKISNKKKVMDICNNCDVYNNSEDELLYENNNIL